MVFLLATAKDDFTIPVTNIGLSKESSWSTLVQSYQRSEMFQDIHRTLSGDLQPKFDLNEPKHPPKYNSSFATQVKQCTLRQSKIYFRNKAVSVGALVRSIVLAGMSISTFAAANQTHLFFFLSNLQCWSEHASTKWV